MALQPTRRRFTTAEYHQMARAGILGEDDRVELIDGEIVQMTPIGRQHSASVDRLAERFILKFSDVAQVRIQNPIHLGEYAEPEPDLALLRRRPDYYLSRHPTPQDVLLVVEVADSSLEYDRRVKMLLYAQSGIPEAWLVDLEQDVIVVYRDPSPQGYRTVRVVRRGEPLAPSAFPERELSADEILG